ncbi:FAD binding domain-containing protein [Brevibacillus sp. B_LB10_24]|uniref:FAD binding domain-containing protein n=1 Tax=Brevibacillus sp. B_LB10_24 TaxID=3380645 RepID=UPI0038BD45E5
MKPAVFDYYSPQTVHEALLLLEQHGFEAKILAGGQSLIPTMNMRLASPKVLIDLGRIGDLESIRLTEEEIRIGGMTRQYLIEQSPEVARDCPMLAEGIKLIGHPQIRSRGTVGGSLVHADPTAELPVILCTLGGAVTLASLDGERVVPAEEFFLTYLTTAIEPNEILVAVQIPRIQAGSGHAIEEFALRKGDFAIVLAAAAVTLDEAGKIAAASLGLGGVDGAPVKLDQVTDALLGLEPDSRLIQECCEQIRDIVEPEADIHASAEYRRDLSVTLSRRALETALSRARLSLSGSDNR